MTMFITKAQMKNLNKAVEIMEDAGFKVFGAYPAAVAYEFVVSAKGGFFMVDTVEKTMRKLTGEEFTEFCS